MIRVDICVEVVGDKLPSDCLSEPDTVRIEGFEGSLDKEGKSFSAIENLTGLDGRARKSKEVCLAYRCGVGNGRRAPLDDVVEEGEDNDKGGSTDAKEGE